MTDRYQALREAIAAGPAQGPWELRDTSGAGLEIYARVDAVMGKPFADLVGIYGFSSVRPPQFQIAYERWVQFPEREWEEMQRANGKLMAAADPDTIHALLDERDALREALKGLRDALPSATTHPAIQAAVAALSIGGDDE